MKTLDIVFFGLSITSSWGNGHATTFRGLIKALAARGHRVTFFEKDVPWYATNRDFAEPPFCRTILYQSPADLMPYEKKIADADLVVMGSYVGDARKIANRIVELNPACFAFYDIDTPVTIAKMENDDFEYLHPEMIPDFDIYLSFTGGPVLDRLENEFGARMARPLYCSVDTDIYYPETDAENFIETGDPFQYSLGYLGTYSEDRQPSLQRLLVDPAKQLSSARFCVAGAQYPEDLAWPTNVERVEHIPPHQHRKFYNAQRFTLNITRQDMLRCGYAPSVRLFEAGACGTPVISDNWPGIEEFFTVGEDMLVAETSKDVLQHLNMAEDERRELGKKLQENILASHTSTHRAFEIELYWQELQELAPESELDNSVLA